jgi:hypothetical protein
MEPLGGPLTAKSKRRDAEMAVIDAAVAWHAASEVPADDYVIAWANLHGAVQEYQNLGLAEPDKVRTVTHAPETSHEAAASMRARAGSDAHAVFQTIWLAWKRESVGLTTDQIEARLSRTHQSISARVNQLKNEGWIIDSGYRLRTRSGRKAIVWTPTNVGKGVYL